MGLGSDGCPIILSSQHRYSYRKSKATASERLTRLENATKLETGSRMEEMQEME